MVGRSGQLCSHWSPRGDGECLQREGNALFDDFWYFWSCKSTRNTKNFQVFLKKDTSSVSLRLPPFSLWLGHARVLTALGAVIHSPRAASLPAGEGSSSAFSFADAAAKEKAIKKKTPRGRFRALRSATVAADGSRRLLKKAGENSDCGEVPLLKNIIKRSEIRHGFHFFLQRLLLYLCICPRIKHCRFLILYKDKIFPR